MPTSASSLSSLVLISSTGGPSGHGAGRTIVTSVATHRPRLRCVSPASVLLPTVHSGSLTGVVHPSECIETCEVARGKVEPVECADSMS